MRGELSRAAIRPASSQESRMEKDCYQETGLIFRQQRSAEKPPLQSAFSS